MVWERLKKFLESEDMLLKLITPINLEEEKKKFFDSSSYEPRFKYCWTENQNMDWRVTKKYDGLWRAIVKQDSMAIQGEGEKIFQVKIQDRVIKKAQANINRGVRYLSQVGLLEIEKRFKEIFEWLELDWKVEVMGLGFNFRPRYKDRTLLIGEELSLEFFSIEGEIRHELTHIIRYENGIVNQIKKEKNYLPTEEGLASYMHDYKGHEENYSLYQHSAEYLATKVSLESGLRGVIDFFRSIGCSQDLAWQRGVRHKFGFIDAGMSGDIMKPAMYFNHELKIKDLNDQEKLQLMMGKVALGSKQLKGKYKGKINKARLIEFYEMEIK